MQWYVVNITSGFEQKIKNTIETQENLRRVRKQVIIPVVKRKKFLRDKLYYYSEKLFPGYVFVGCEEETVSSIFNVVSEVPGVLNMSGINGYTRIFERIEDEEMEHVINLISDKRGKIVDDNIDLELNKKVRVVDGPFSSFQGVVLDVNRSTKKETKVRIGTSLNSGGGVSSIVVPASFVEVI